VCAPVIAKVGAKQLVNGKGAGEAAQRLLWDLKRSYTLAASETGEERASIATSPGTVTVSENSVCRIGNSWLQYEVSPGGPIAQRLEPPAHNRVVPGSNPGGPTSLA
jgi:hypothetical protein